MGFNGTANDLSWYYASMVFRTEHFNLKRGLAMASTSSQADKNIDNLFDSVLKGTGLLFSCFFIGIYETRKKIPALIFAAASLIPVTLALCKRLLGIGENKYVLYSVAVPVLVVIVLGAIKEYEKFHYQKAFENIRFIGRNGLAPKCISSNKVKGKTTAFFKSNIPLSIWKKELEYIQTEIDCQILLIQQGKSKKIVKLVYMPADYDLGDMIPWDRVYLSKITSEIILGESSNSQIKFDFNVTPHWILAGSTGSGKSVLMRLVVYQCIVKGFRIIIMDFKYGVEFGRMYDRFSEVVMQKKRAVQVLQSLVEENKRRLEIIRNENLKDIEGYNKRHPHDPMERIVLFIDELAILLMPTAEKEDKELTKLATACLEHIAILGRAAGINMVFGIQRPDANTVTGQIKSNVSGRVCGYFSDPAPSLIVLTNTKANELPSKTKGRFMFQDGEETVEFQGYYLNDAEEIKNLPDREPTEPDQEQAPDPPELSVVHSQRKPAKGKKKRPNLKTDYEDVYYG